METDVQKSGHESLPSTASLGQISTDLNKEPGPEPETPKMAHDSMVTVRLSEPASISLSEPDVTKPDAGTLQSTPTKHQGASSEGVYLDETEPHNQFESKDETKEEGSKAVESIELAPEEKLQSGSVEVEGSLEIAEGLNREDEEDGEESPETPRDSVTTMPPPIVNRNLREELKNDDQDDPDEVNWEQLQKTEDEQVKDEETDNSTALLLARLEQENAKLATNPKSVKVQAVDRATAERAAVSKPRPPSMAQLRQMVQGPTPPALRYSMLPPPPMTDLEFYAALVKDYQQTAARLPTLLSNKIRKGIPPPLRGVVWQSMSGARDAALEEQYDRLSGESSPYEVIIGKDLGRSFPGVDMFRDPEGDGQRMLGRVLKCFSLYDTKIGYCQGLAFLVGPLLMHMPDKQAFCVLVRLMEVYDLRACFLPDLSGLHVRIYQFRELLRQILPVLSNHLEELQVDPAYVSQWFLSFFAVTCPLPMLFRIYDVIFAEGASETIMRVALSLMRKNETRLLACTELEDVMQLLLSRGLWDCYHYNADEFVQDFVGLTGVVTRESLQQLEQSYKDSKAATASPGRGSDISNAASRFLGRIWASSTTSFSPKSATTLSPGNSAPSRPLSMLRRSASKQSLASTLNSIEASSASVASSASTDATTVSRDSSNTEDGGLSRESTLVGVKTASTMGKPADDRHLHSQIEDLLTALSELQRNHALLSTQLQREREERQEDRKAVQSLLSGLRNRAIVEPATPHTSSGPEVKILDTDEIKLDDKDDLREEELDNDGSKELEKSGETIIAHQPADDDTAEAKDNATEVDPIDTLQEAKDTDSNAERRDSPSTEDLEHLLEMVERRFHVAPDNRRSSMLQSKAQLREELVQVKDQLTSAISQTQEYNRQNLELGQELSSTKEQLRESHAHVRTLHQERQRLEKQLTTMRSRLSTSSTNETSREAESDTARKASGAGLRELKLGRTKSMQSQGGSEPSSPFNKRISSLTRGQTDLGVPTVTTTAPGNENESLLLELVQAKTAEAMAKQEAEEARQKLEAFRKSHGLPHSETAPASTQSQTGSMGGVFGLLTGHGASEAPSKPASTMSGGSPSSGGFWGWRR